MKVNENKKRDSVYELEKKLISKIKSIREKLDTDYYYLQYHEND